MDKVKQPPEGSFEYAPQSAPEDNCFQVIHVFSILGEYIFANLVYTIGEIGVLNYIPSI